MIDDEKSEEEDEEKGLPASTRTHINTSLIQAKQSE